MGDGVATTRTTAVEPRQARPAGEFSKVSVTVPTEMLAEARERAGRGGLSGYVAGAVADRLAADRLAELNDQLEAEFGPVPDELVAAAEAAWPSDVR